MDIIASLREQLDSLCDGPGTEPDWILERLVMGLRSRFGRVGVGLVRPSENHSLVLLGLCGPDGSIQIRTDGQFRERPRHRRLQVADFKSEIWLEADRLRFDGEAMASLADARAVFFVPWLIDDPSDLMILIVSAVPSPAGLTQDRGLSVSVNLLATNLLRSVEAQRLAGANAWIDREMREIQRIQEQLQPDIESLAGVDIAVHAVNYKYAGGDYFDIPKLTHLAPPEQHVPDHDHFGVIIADASGHGPSAAVEAAMLDAVTRTYDPPPEAGPGDFLSYLNRHLFTRKPRPAFISAFVCRWNPATSSIAFACAGHPPPLLRAAGSKAFEPLPVPADIPLHVEREYTFQTATRSMQSGDALVLFTDGVIEARAPDGRQMGRDALPGLIPAEAHSAASILNCIVEGLTDHLDGNDPQDDQTIIVIRFR